MRLEQYETYGRKVGYATGSTGQRELFNWLRENPHRLHLGRIGLLTSSRSTDLQQTEQTLDLWTGTLTSRFQLAGKQLLRADLLPSRGRLHRGLHRRR